MKCEGTYLKHEVRKLYNDCVPIILNMRIVFQANGCSSVLDIIEIKEDRLRGTIILAD